MTEVYDVLLIGGGLVGASLGCAMAGSGLRVGLIDAAVQSAARVGNYDDRVIALSAGSQRVFQAIEVWPGIAAEAEPIHRIHISERGRFGVAVLEAEQERVEALGYVCPARRIGLALQARLAQVPEVTNLSPARFAGLQLEENLARVSLDTDDGSLDVAARLVVAADGARSPVRDWLKIPSTRWSYGQSAVIANVSMGRHHQNVAYERFTEDGPVALLPMTEDRCALVLTVPDRVSGKLLAMCEDAFAATLAERFGGRLGRVLKVGRREAHSLELVKAQAHFRSRVALIGNAAHTLHPVAGQGFNLGLRDVAVLAEVIVDAARADEDPGVDATLARYARWRGADQWRTAGFTDALVRIFGNPLLPVRVARGFGLLAFQALPPVRRLLARQAMGLTGPLPRLARGLAL